MCVQCRQLAAGLFIGSNRNDRCNALVRSLDARSMTFPCDILHQHAVTRTERPLFAVTGRHFEMALQADKKLMLGWMD